MGTIVKDVKQQSEQDNESKGLFTVKTASRWIE
jgi:hypothetical protein